MPEPPRKGSQSMPYHDKKPELRGVIVPVITPLLTNEELNVSALEKLLNYLISTGVDGIFTGGSAGMGPMLDEQVWRDLMAHSLRIVAGRCALLGGVIEASTKRAVRKIKILESLGYGTMVVTPTFYITLRTPDEFLRHFSICREASTMQMLAYNIPSCTGSEIPLECLKEMGKRKWIAGFKESSASKSYFRQASDIAGNCGFKIFQGNENDICWSLKNGADGIVPVCANFSPELFVEAWRSGTDCEKSGQLQHRIDANKLKYVVADSKSSWISGVVSETSRRLKLDCSVAAPLKKCDKFVVFTKNIITSQLAENCHESANSA